jgi:imidazoleglycerol-phosphate dehydratase/histidinol-phosphatase
LAKIAELDYELVMVTNQDGLGTDSFRKIRLANAKFHLESFENEGVLFDDIL